MKGLLKLVSLGAVLASAAAPAFADPLNQISFAGTETYCGTTSTSTCSAGAVTFTYNYPVAPGTATGIFAPFSGSTATFNNFNYLSTTTPFTLLTDSYNGQTLSFIVTSMTYKLGSSLEVLGNGYYLLNGTRVNGGTFDLNTQGAAGSTVTFADSNTISVTPEPNSLMLLGTGLVGAAAMMVRRRRAIV